MGYLRRYTQRRRRPAMGDVISTVVDVANDPYLAEVACRIQQLKQIESGQTPGECAQTPDNLPGSVGLRNAMPFLRAYVYAEQNKWVYPLAAVAILGLPLWIGYEMGKG